MMIVTGLSGSGKSVVLESLEDLGYYCIDNVPLMMLESFHQMFEQHAARFFQQTVVAGVDVRNFLDEIQSFAHTIQRLQDSGVEVRVIYLTASNDVLLKRYSETRRRHPLSFDGLPLMEAIAKERHLLEDQANMAKVADLTIDSSETNVHELRSLVKERLHASAAVGFSLLFQSFGFKKGVPADADFVFDVRCLPNPHWDASLRQYTGRDEGVARFLSQQADVRQMQQQIQDFLSVWLPKFQNGTRSYLTVAIGCTGGQHRSVYLTEQLGQHFKKYFNHVGIRHRELQN